MKKYIRLAKRPYLNYAGVILSKGQGTVEVDEKIVDKLTFWIAKGIVVVVDPKEALEEGVPEALEVKEPAIQTPAPQLLEPKPDGITVEITREEVKKIYTEEELKAFAKKEDLFPILTELKAEYKEKDTRAVLEAKILEAQK